MITFIVLLFIFVISWTLASSALASSQWINRNKIRRYGDLAVTLTRPTLLTHYLMGEHMIPRDMVEWSEYKRQSAENLVLSESWISPAVALARFSFAMYMITLPTMIVFEIYSFVLFITLSF